MLVLFDVASVHTADLEAADLRRIRQLLERAFDDSFEESDWEHTIGGVHVLLRRDGELAGHASVVQRRLFHAGASIRTGYVEAVAVAAEHRRRGAAGMLMAEAERIITTAYDLGALGDGTEIEGFYQRFGWLAWRGPTSTLTPAGMHRTPAEDGYVLVLPTPTSPHLDLDGPIACDWRPGDAW